MPNFDQYERQQQAGADEGRAAMEEHRREVIVGQIAGRYAAAIAKPLSAWTSADVMKAFANVARDAWEAARAAL